MCVKCCFRPRRWGACCPVCYTNAKGRTNVRGHFGYREPRVYFRGHDVGLQRRVSGGNGGDGGGTADLSGKSLAALPNVAEFLTLARWPGGEERELGTLMLVFGDGVWKAWLNDKDAGLSAWVSAESLCALWKRVEAILGGEGHEWRKTKPVGAGKRRGA
jgi:hypothetical protein